MRVSQASGKVGILGQPDAGLEQPAQFIGKRAQPAAGKRQFMTELRGQDRMPLHRRMRLQTAQAIGGSNPRDVLRKRKQHVPAAVATADEQAGITLRIGRLQPDQVRPLRPFPDFGRTLG